MSVINKNEEYRTLTIDLNTEGLSTKANIKT